LLADGGDKADAQLVLGVWHNHDSAPVTMSKYVVRAPNAF
jgi:hypothetical protein